MIRTEHQSLRQGLVGAWCPSLGASGRSLIDRSGRGLHIPLESGGPNFVPSRDGLITAATYRLTSATSNIAGATRLTIAAWTTGGNFGFTNASNTSGKRFVIQPNSNNVCYVCIEGGTGASFPNFPLTYGVLAHVCVVFDGSQSGLSRISCFVNGSARNVTAGGFFPAAAAASPHDPLSVEGSFDDLRIYNRALTLSEIRLLASRRGIGLLPLPDRAAGLPRKLFVNDAGTWRDGDAYVNTGSGWRLGDPLVNVAGTWR